MSYDPFQALYPGTGGVLLLLLTTIESTYPTVCVCVHARTRTRTRSPRYSICDLHFCRPHLVCSWLSICGTRLQRRGGTKSCVQQCTKTPDEKFDMEYMQRMCCFLKWRFCFLRQNCSRCFLETQHAGQEAEELASDRPNAVLNVVPAWPAEFVGFHEAKCSVICGEMASRESSRPPVEH